MLKNIKCIGFDADDTLWHNEIYYLKGEDAFKSLLTDIVPRDILNKTFADIENQNMPLLGYGAKAMTISIVHLLQNDVSIFRQYNLIIIMIKNIDGNAVISMIHGSVSL